MKLRTSVRLKTGLIAFALILSQVVMPVQSAFATDTGIAEAKPDKEPKKVYVCKYVGTPGVNERLKDGKNPIEVSVNATGGATEGSYFNDAQGRSYVLGPVVAGEAEPLVTQCPNVVDVSKISVTSVPNCGPNNDIVVLTPASLAGVTYSQSAWVNNKLTVTATLKAGYSWSDGTTVASKSFVLNDAGVICEKESQLPTPKVTDPCGPRNASWATQASSTEYTWSQQNGELVVTANAGVFFMVAGNKVYSHNFGKAVDSGTACPTIAECRTLKDTIIVSTKEQFADIDGSLTNGKYEFMNDGVKIYTTDNSNLAKVAWYKNVDIAMGDLGVPAIDFTQTTGTQAPGLQLGVDFNGDGTTDGLLVGESSFYGSNWWLTNGSAQFAKDAAPHVGGGYGSAYYGTLDEWFGVFQQAHVKQIGFSLGSGVFASGVLKSMTFGCKKYIFKKTYVAAEPVTIEKCGRLDDKFTIPTSEGVDYYVYGQKVSAGTYSAFANSSITVTAKAKNGYTLSGKTKWTLDFTNEACKPSVDVKLSTYCHPDGQMFVVKLENDTKSWQRYEVVVRDSDGDVVKTFKVNVSLYGSETVSWLATQDDEYTFSAYSYNDGKRSDRALWSESVETECASDVFTPEIYKEDQDGLYVPARFTVEVCQLNDKWSHNSRTPKWNCTTYYNVEFGQNGDWFKNNVDYKMYKETKFTITETYTPSTCTSEGPWTFTWSKDKKHQDKSMIDSLTFGGKKPHHDDGMGEWSNGSNEWVLLNECTPGQGSTGDEPVDSEGGEGEGQLPVELPMTGNSGALTTWFGLLAAIITYGAVYLLQPKKRSEDQ